MGNNNINGITFELKDILNYIIGNGYIVKNIPNADGDIEEGKVVLENYYRGEKEDEMVFDVNDLGDLTNLINEITLKDYNKWGCDNLYILKGSGGKMGCNNPLERVVRTIYDIQIGNDINNKDKKGYIDDMIEDLEEYRKQL